MARQGSEKPPDHTFKLWEGGGGGGGGLKKNFYRGGCREENVNRQDSFCFQVRLELLHQNNQKRGKRKGGGGKLRHQQQLCRLAFYPVAICLGSPLVSVWGQCGRWGITPWPMVQGTQFKVEGKGTVPMNGALLTLIQQAGITAP